MERNNGPFKSELDEEGCTLDEEVNFLRFLLKLKKTSLKKDERVCWKFCEGDYCNDEKDLYHDEIGRDYEISKLHCEV